MMVKNKLNIQAWWTAPVTQVADRVFAAKQQIENDQFMRKQKLVTHASLYDNKPYSGLEYDKYWLGDVSAVEMEGELSGQSLGANMGGMGLVYNVTKSVIDTLTARITKHKPLAKFITAEGEWSDQQRAKKLNKFIEGQFNNLNVFKHVRQCFKDACIFGTGIIKIQRVGDAFKVDRVMPDDLFVPMEESRLGNPRQMHHRSWIHGEVLASLFPRKREDILNVARSKATGAGMVEVVESWHLPSNDIGDGRRTICIEGVTLLDKEWTVERFPFAFLHFDSPTVGFWGQGIVEAGKDMQAALNEMVVLVAAALRLASRPIILVKRGAKIATQKFDNRFGAIYEVDDLDDFKAIGVDALPNGLVQQRAELFEKFYAIMGTSQLSAQSKKPSGLDSGAALREFGDIESDRFAVQQQQYEELILEIARHLIRLAREAYDEGIDIETKNASKEFFQSIKWSDVDLDDSKYVMRVDPVSQLPRTPAGKLQRVQELLQGGLIDQRYALQLLDLPDLESVTELENARLNDTYDLIERFLGGGEYETPEAFQDLELGIELMRAAYLKNRHIAPEDALQKMRTWIVDATFILDAMQPMQPEMAPPMPGEGGGGGDMGPTPGQEGGMV